MRVISGSKKGYKLKGPKGKDIRPTEDRIKESLFNILGYINEGSTALDLFAGSGSIGIEFLSRGASKVYFIDKSYWSIRAIKENLIRTKLEEKAVVIKNDAIKGIRMLDTKNIKFDYIFADPPYGENLIIRILENIWNQDILKMNGTIILEHEKSLVLGNEVHGFRRMDFRNYGGKSLSFYTN